MGVEPPPSLLSEGNPASSSAAVNPNPTAYVDEIEHLGFPIFFAELELLVSRLKRRAKEEEQQRGSGGSLAGGGRIRRKCRQRQRGPPR